MRWESSKPNTNSLCAHKHPRQEKGTERTSWKHKKTLQVPKLDKLLLKFLDPELRAIQKTLTKQRCNRKKQKKKLRRIFVKNFTPDVLSEPVRPPMSTWDGLWHQSWLTYDAVLSSSCQGLSIPSHLTQITANDQRMTARWVSDSQVTLTNREARTHMASTCEPVKKNIWGETLKQVWRHEFGALIWRRAKDKWNLHQQHPFLLTFS